LKPSLEHKPNRITKEMRMS